MTRFAVDDSPVWTGDLSIGDDGRPRLWNGAIVPIVSRATMEAIAAWGTSENAAKGEPMAYDIIDTPHGDGIMWQETDGYTTGAILPVQVGDDAYVLDIGWCFQRVDD